LKSYTLYNGNIRAVFLSFGAILHELWVKNRDGNFINIIQGYTNLKNYITDSWSRGAIIGRYAGRLTNPLKVNEKFYEIENEKGVMLHSGSQGWGKKNWDLVDLLEKKRVELKYECPAGTTGFPGKVKANISYSLENNKLNIDYSAISESPTHINLTNHAYFNLNNNEPIGNSYLNINADKYLELDKNLVPTGKKLLVNKTSLDFRNSKRIGKIRLDDYFVVNQTNSPVVEFFEPKSGINMSIFTNQPGLVVFTPPHFEAICFETQKFSNTPNILSFPSTLINPDEIYRHKTTFVFNILKNI
tara:strand:+ start:30910 stop:31815 length:906 start_codon:yes stop_codon:yes gene_type:complete